MFAGHIGAGLVIGRAEPSVNVGVFIAAALLLDLLLWLFVLFGWESIVIPANFAATHQPEFVFPYSHGLAAALLWAVLAGALGLAFYSRLRSKWRVAALVAVAVLSHWVLDAVVHRPELPLAGPASRTVGLGLWNRMPVALVLEAAIVGVGLYLFLAGARIGRGRSTALLILILLAMVFTAVGMTIAPAPPSATAMAATSAATLVLVCALVYRFGRVLRQA